MPIPLPMKPPGGGLVECTECARCCTYVAVDINAPSRPRWATDILWYLYHEGVSVYVDGDGEWCVQFEARCRNLGDDLRCQVYAERPHICRAFDNQTCEVNGEGISHTFREPREFLAFLQRTRPRVYAKISEKYVPDSVRPRARVARPARAGRG